jgi:S-DNA-T family DNA segregation ATPase FtsK/SpoIIIE
MATSFARSFPGSELHYFGTKRSAVAHLPCWTTRSISIEEIQTTAQDVATRLGADGAPRTAIFIESAGDYVSSPAEQALQQLVRVCANEEHWFVAEGELSSVTTSQGFLAQVKAAREGLILQPDPESGQGLLKTPLGRIHRNEFPVGRGVYISAGQIRIVQVAMPGAEGEREG